ncbi:NAD-dependent epimerase/dehydratase family protein [Pseudonocardia acidicola]|uniref:NAD-dependent epimerase/dehydratase family protein n=1 Tax=Pseudonocardia acidicola TaxID=2724939 RepID=A0ABX1SEU7_9PSEU|nr:NAD-dependent epimerase/dehydratase family protein [Pseudonocardia acidicola]
MRAVVTGGAGFIGSHVVDAVTRDDAQVLVIDDLSRGTKANLADGVELATIDIRDGEAVRQAFRDFRPDLVFHLAAQIDVRHSMADPAHDANINIRGSINVFAAAQETGVRRVVNTSTGGAIYGEGAPVPTPEITTPEPVSAYGLSKLTAERYARWFRAHGVDVVTLRCGNVYGPRQDPRGDAGVIALFCDRALAGRRPTVYGDGRQTRDFVYAEDVAAANVAAATAGALPHAEYNIGTGIEVTVLELAGIIAAEAGVDPAGFDPVFAPPRAGELARSCLDVTRARRDLGLAPPTAIGEGISRTLAWIRSVSG